MGKQDELKIDGRIVRVSNLDKVLYPGEQFTKAQVIDYYIRVSAYFLPHLRDRPVTLKRYPDGVRGEFFYEKDAPGYTPKWVKTFPVPRRSGESDICYILVNDPFNTGLGRQYREPRVPPVPALRSKFAATHFDRLRPRSR